jgi:acetate kinase
MLKQILVINTGSTSLKYGIYDLKSQSFLINNSSESIIDLRQKYNFNDFDFILHRIVFGGNYFDKPVEITSTTIKILDTLSPLAPLHNPKALEVIKQIYTDYPQIKQVALFDSTFHKTIPNFRSLYGIDKKFREKFNIQRYGYHGFAHKYNLQTVSKNKNNNQNVKLISIHLGGGCSICAIKNGQSVATSMGFSPEEGLLMATRCGDIGAGAVLYLQKNLNLNHEQMLTLLTKESGLQALTGIENGNMKIILDQYSNTNLNKNSIYDKTALNEVINLFVENIVKYVSFYISLLQGVDTIIFSGGIGEGSSYLRSRIIDYFSYLNIKIDTEKNYLLDQKEQFEKAELISSSESKTLIYVIKSDEQSQIIQDFLEYYKLLF